MEKKKKCEELFPPTKNVSPRFCFQLSGFERIRFGEVDGTHFQTISLLEAWSIEPALNLEKG